MPDIGTWIAIATALGLIYEAVTSRRRLPAQVSSAAIALIEPLKKRIQELEEDNIKLAKALADERCKRQALEDQVTSLLSERDRLEAENEQLRDRVAELERRMGPGPLKES